MSIFNVFNTESFQCISLTTGVILAVMTIKFTYMPLCNEYVKSRKRRDQEGKPIAGSIAHSQEYEATS